MPLVNYCKKCCAEVPVGEACPYCGGKLTKPNEQISFGTVIKPAREWFAWNNLLRVMLPVWFLVAAGSLAAEGLSGGNVALMISQGYLIRMLVLLGVMLLLILLLLLAQGTEHVHYVLDKDGIHARTYLKEPTSTQVYARFQSPAGAQHLQETDSRLPLQGFLMVRRVTIPWDQVRRIRFWKEGTAVLIYRPSFWQALAMYCPMEEQEAVEDYVRKKMKKFKEIPVEPVLEKPKKK